MSDAFADLWNSTGAAKPAEPPRKLGAMAAATNTMQTVARRPQNDVFSMLAAAGSSSSNTSRSATPAQSPALGSNAPRPMQKTPSGGPAKPIGLGGGGGDAFSGLLSGTFSSASNGANLTMAQRAALAEKERIERTQKTHAPVPAVQVSSAWAGLDALGASSVSTTHTQTSTPAHDALDHLGFDSFSSSPAPAPVRTASKSPQPASALDDDWGFGDFPSQPPAAPPRSMKATPISDLLGFDDFVPASSSRQSSSPAPPRSDTPGDFDFGDREDGLLGDQSDEDDILGDLGKPIEQLAAKRSTRNTPSPQPPQSGQRSRAVSPPPHVLGQIVEMGFSIQQAKVALAATDSGLDVQAALETLLSNGAGASSPAPEQERQRRPQRETGHERYYSSDEENVPSRPPQHPPARASPQSQPRAARERPGRDGQALTGDNARNLQGQADELIAQASKIGLSMFNRANALFKEGKERAMRAYEERSAAAAAAAAGSSRQNTGEVARRNGRPKWMQDAAEDEHVSSPTQNGGGFKDHDDDDDLHHAPARPQAKQPPPRAQEPPQPAETPLSRMKVGNLFSDDAPTVYVSPFRRKTPARTQATETPSPAPAAASRPTPPSAPSPAPLIQRQTVSASQSAIAASAQQKAAGTEKFKLGQYGEAETFYSAAIAALPDKHLLLIPLYNNRALTRLKNGDAAGAIEDCTVVIDLIGPAYHPSKEAKVTREDEGASVDLADALIKAWRRRAEAYEGKEKWELAKQDWESIAGSEFAGKARTEAFTGISRCRRMLNANVDAAAPARPPAAKSRPASARPIVRSRVPTPPSEALNRVREANVAAEAEDQEKHELKDTVDARLMAWRAGKENNIRALIASLDTVLWPELGWQKVGIHELVSPSQVKIRYTKAIAKLHPDKLNVKNTTLEQRMIANGVFGSLNEAWNAFKP
ncbi:hypothetical protein L226DRAFT_499569 [Lentinus tigrinus ALCF2SS1-7]|uniref:uncharacterized protein n=1 Tax=Lentinus tigrinus ALCF2SS1-7 TaxID=1328758 RepID=UPI001166084F|nr:hypothetical protein L226DRAFT_499569 [Lentinus tigrinus ALCF2SS1-7]